MHKWYKPHASKLTNDSFLIHHNFVNVSKISIIYSRNIIAKIWWVIDTQIYRYIGFPSNLKKSITFRWRKSGIIDYVPFHGAKLHRE